MLPSLSVVIPTHNRPELLRACLYSVMQFAPAGTEVLVVDDASPYRAASHVAAGFAEVSVRRLPRRSGFCVAANEGIRHVRGDVVEMLNDDAEVTAGWAEGALARFADPAIAAVAPLVLKPGSQEFIDSAGDRYFLGGVAGKHGRGQRLHERYLQPDRVFGASASSAFFRRDVLLRVGAFPESFGAYFEDVDLAFRLHGAGYQVMFEPASRVLHHVSASYGRPKRALLAQQSRNEERVFWRNLPQRVLARALPGHLAVLAVKTWRRWQEGNIVPFLCGRLQVLAEAPEIMRHRRWLRPFAAMRNLESWQVDSHLWT